VRTRLTNIIPAPVEAYLFSYNAQEINSIIKNDEISTSSSRTFIAHPIEGGEIAGWNGRRLHGFFISILDVWGGKTKLGQISVRLDTFAIYETIANPDIQPLVEFVENIMTRSGSACSAISWIRHIGSLEFRYVLK
jgi:hypothetical protein